MDADADGGCDMRGLPMRLRNNIKRLRARSEVGSRRRFELGLQMSDVISNRSAVRGVGVEVCNE